MADQLILDSPFGPLAFTPDQVQEASARANEMLIALGLASGLSPTPSTGEKWLTVSQTSELMNLPLSYLYEALNSGGINGRKFGRFWRIPESYTHENKLLIRGSSNGST